MLLLYNVYVYRYSEVSYFDRSYINPFQYQNAYGHFSQVVWADTDKIGCGIAHFKVYSYIIYICTLRYVISLH